jgi:nicotinate-nucleotide adenylyltransferase
VSDPAPSWRIGNPPVTAPGMRIGLLGGSFNPAHEAHRAVSLFAWKRLALDRVWWIVSPGNPLKDTSRLPPLDGRVAQASAIAHSPFIEVTGLEATFGTRFTYDTVARLRAHLPTVRFVLLTGADILAEFHRWKNWRALAGLIPFAVIDRDGWTFRALASPAAKALSAARMPEAAAKLLASQEPPRWVYLHGLKLAQSSSALRNARGSRPEG